MIQTSATYREIVQKNVRPKCEPEIKIVRFIPAENDSYEEEVVATFGASSIKKMKFSREIDPTGKDLPSMTLEWEEVYFGQINENGVPVQYENIKQGQEVRLVFKQALDFTPQASIENISFPSMFLAGTPTVSSSKIKWKARDLLSFVSQTEAIHYESQFTRGNVFRNIIYNGISANLYSPEVCVAICDTAKLIPIYSWDISSYVMFDGEANSLLKDFAATENAYFDFFQNNFVKKKFFDSFAETGVEIPVSVMYEEPIVSDVETASEYEFTNTISYINTYVDKQETITSSSVEVLTPVNHWFDRVYVYHFTLQKPMRPLANLGPDHRDIIGEDPDDTVLSVGGYDAIKYVYYEYGDVMPASIDLVFCPIVQETKKEIILLNSVGKAYKENNKLNRYDSQLDTIYKRSVYLSRYYGWNLSNVEISIAADLALETSDVVLIQTNRFNGSGDRIKKKCVITKIEIEYSGALKERIRGHEVFENSIGEE